MLYHFNISNIGFRVSGAVVNQNNVFGSTLCWNHHGELSGIAVLSCQARAFGSQRGENPCYTVTCIGPLHKNTGWGTQC